MTHVTRPAPPVRKRFGQHFLTDRRILARIVDALAPHPGETVVEIGPGRGALTDLLRERTGRVVAIEVDRALAALLAERYSGDGRMRVIQADVLTVNLWEAAGGPYALVGNLPYNLTTPILFHSLRRPRPARAVFLVQREVADRMRAPPGGKAYGALSVNLQAVAQVRRRLTVPAGAFVPAPRVESAVVEVLPRADPVVSPDEEEAFRRFIQAVFGQRRKQIRRVVRGIVPLSQSGAADALGDCGIAPEARPESLHVAHLARLFRRLQPALVAVGKGVAEPL